MAIRILIVTPAPVGSKRGNRITADRWKSIFDSLGHGVSIGEKYVSGQYDLLIALHAKKSAGSIKSFAERHPGGRIIVAMTGTDLNYDLGHVDQVSQSLDLADRIVVLEPLGKQKLSSAERNKTRVILQSACPWLPVPIKLKRFFEISVIGHLRPVKDPFRTAMASRLLPARSRVRVVHLGKALSATMARRAQQEMKENRRYRWLGEVTHPEAQRRLARSRLTVLSSESEGGPAVISEAIVNGVPILATRIEAAIGLLGRDYGGFFEFGDHNQLARLIEQAEMDSGFYQGLLRSIGQLRPQFSLRRETANWASLISEIRV